MWIWQKQRRNPCRWSGSRSATFRAVLTRRSLKGAGSTPAAVRAIDPLAPTRTSRLAISCGGSSSPDQGEVYTRIGGTNIFRGPTIAFEAAHSNGQTIYGTHYFKSKSIATFSSIFAASSQSPAKGCECMCCYGLACKVPCSIPACITKGSRPWLKKCCVRWHSGDYGSGDPSFPV